MVRYRFDNWLNGIAAGFWEKKSQAPSLTLDCSFSNLHFQGGAFHAEGSVPPELLQEVIPDWTISIHLNGEVYLEPILVSGVRTGARIDVTALRAGKSSDWTSVALRAVSQTMMIDTKLAIMIALGIQTRPVGIAEGFSIRTKSEELTDGIAQKLYKEQVI